MDGERCDFDGEECGDDDDDDDGDQEAKKKKKKKKSRRRNKKKRAVHDSVIEGRGGDSTMLQEKQDFVGLYPFTSSSSATQRKIKQQYDELIKCHHHSKGLTLAQVFFFSFVFHICLWF